MQYKVIRTHLAKSFPIDTWDLSKGITPSTDFTDFEVMVEEAIRDGWKLQGGVSLTSVDSTSGVWAYIAQAVVKDKD